jgi:hypothetical protein
MKLDGKIPIVFAQSKSLFPSLLTFIVLAISLVFNLNGGLYPTLPPNQNVMSSFVSNASVLRHLPSAKQQNRE